MTQRFQELSLQARQSVPSGLGVDQWIEAYNEQLGRLVVQDTIGVMSELVNNSDNRGLYNVGEMAVFFETAVKKHFGVEP